MFRQENFVNWKTATLVLLAAMWLGLHGMVRAQNFSQPIGLRALADNRYLLFGTAVDPNSLTGTPTAPPDAGVVKIVTRDFNMIETGNEFKPYRIWKGSGVYDFTVPDRLLGSPGETGWVQQHRMTFRAHVLVYDSVDYAIPGWLRALDTPAKQPDKVTATKYLRDYIHALVGRYKGKIAVWDVVNEAVQRGKSDDPVHNPYNLKKTLWYRWIGPDYIDLAFQFAHEADPSAQLYYNDYNNDFVDPKYPYNRFDNVLKLVTHLRNDKGIPANVGMQWHVDVNTRVTPGDGHYLAAQALRDRGIDFMVTELDVKMPVKPYPKDDPRYGLEPVNLADLEKQAAVFGDVLRYALSFSNCKGFQLWGFTDKGSWIPGVSPGDGAATIMTADLKPKPAYFALQRELDPAAKR